MGIKHNVIAFKHDLIQKENKPIRDCANRSTLYLDMYKRENSKTTKVGVYLFGVFCEINIYMLTYTKERTKH